MILQLAVYPKNLVAVIREEYVTKIMAQKPIVEALIQDRKHRTKQKVQKTPKRIKKRRKETKVYILILDFIFMCF